MRKPLTLTIASVGVAVAVAGCSSSSGGGSPSSPSGPSAPTSAAASTPAGGDNSTLEGDALKDGVTAAMQAATSFHMAGGATSDDGKQVRFDIHFGPHKTAGSIVQGDEPLELINPGGPSVYFKAPDSLWQQNGGAAAVALFSGKWVKVPADDERFAGLTKSFDKDSFIEKMTSDDGDDSDTNDLRKVGSATVNGTAAIEYKSESEHSELYIAATGAPVILKIVNSSSDGGTLTFSDYGKPYPFAPPPANQTVDFAKLEKAGH